MSDAFLLESAANELVLKIIDGTGDRLVKSFSLLPEEFGSTDFNPMNIDSSLEGSRAIVYSPQYPLWTNGSRKQRVIVLPPHAIISSDNSEHWKFPVGTVIFKSFLYPNLQGTWVPVETRIFLGTAEGWEVATYQWSANFSQAVRVHSDSATPVEVRGAEGQKITHKIPSEFECSVCHGPANNFIIGFDELQLNYKTQSADDRNENVLLRLAEVGFITQLNSQARQLPDVSGPTKDVLGYFEGNCVHCHNQDHSVLDLQPSVAIESLLDQPSRGSMLKEGTLLRAGDPESSLVYLAMKGGSIQDHPDEISMPPLGVQLVDYEFLEFFKGWIERGEFK